MRPLITLLLSTMWFFTSNVHAYEPAGTPSDWDSPMGPQKPFWMFLADRLETGFSDEVDSYVWDAQAWYGTGMTRLWLKSEGEGEQAGGDEVCSLQVARARGHASREGWRAERHRAVASRIADSGIKIEPKTFNEGKKEFKCFSFHKNS